jgi:hypothetical protein
VLSVVATTTLHDVDDGVSGTTSQIGSITLNAALLPIAPMGPRAKLE